MEALEDKADVLNASGNVATSMAVEMHDAATEAGEKIEDVLYEALMAVKGDRTSMQELMFVFNRIAREHVNRQYVDNGENKEEDYREKVYTEEDMDRESIINTETKFWGDIKVDALLRVICGPEKHGPWEG